MRQSTKHLALALTSIVMLLAPAVLAADHEYDLEEALRATKRQTIQAPQSRLGRTEGAALPESDTSTFDGFALGVRNRADLERASSSTAADVSVRATGRSSDFETRYKRDYGVGEWWRGASQTKKTATIVGGAVVFLIIFA